MSTLPVKSQLAWLAVAGAGIILMFRPGDPAQVPAMALSLAAIGLWATGAIPEYLTALGFVTIAMIFAVAPGEIVFAGFQSPALWLILGGLVLGVAVRNTGLGARIARRMAHAFGTSYWGVITGVSVVATLMGFFMPSSMGRVVLLMPIALSLCDEFGFTPGRPGRIGVVLAAALGSHVATFSILPANVPNMVLVGSAETLYHVHFTYGEYLALHFPVLGLAKLMLMIPVIVWLYRDKPEVLVHPEHTTPMSGREKALSGILVTALLLWMTDSWHHISPAWVSMAAGVVLLAPKIALVSPKEFNEQINFGSLFYVGGVLGLGALVSHSGLGSAFAGMVLQFLPLAPNEPIANFAALAALPTLVSMIATVTAAPAVLTPLAVDLAHATGLPLMTVLHSQVLGFSNPLLPYESPPLVVAMALSGEGIGPAQRLCLILGLITILVLLPLDFLWWRLLGMI
ncbi:MAG TPA: SLC13 family permease [Rhodospirillaceae bacterium]|nr:SLC13 family permease [Rhodospirillaceae bacterium]